ncbi:hypothetical protein V8G54_028102 [Vigna mungo]|uniref:Reverse transcriptase Ty1/copia-type domain-containing protein n=1 Tax=Vigna mungo TaxID=3915 RepID=A0AAQ3RJ20_VIGMU
MEETGLATGVDAFGGTSDGYVDKKHPSVTNLMRGRNPMEEERHKPKRSNQKDQIITQTRERGPAEVAPATLSVASAASVSRRRWARGLHAPATVAARGGADFRLCDRRCWAHLSALSTTPTGYNGSGGGWTTAVVGQRRRCNLVDGGQRGKSSEGSSVGLFEEETFGPKGNRFESHSNDTQTNSLFGNTGKKEQNLARAIGAHLSFLNEERNKKLYEVKDCCTHQRLTILLSRIPNRSPRFLDLKYTRVAMKTTLHDRSLTLARVVVRLSVYLCRSFHQILVEASAQVVVGLFRWSFPIAIIKTVVIDALCVEIEHLKSLMESTNKSPFGTCSLAMTVYIDDIIITGNSSNLIPNVTTKLHATFSLKQLGQLD